MQGLITGFLLVAFVGGWIWLYGSKRRAELEAAARMPLDDEPAGPAVNPTTR